MRAFVPDYSLISPPNLTEVLRLLADQPGTWRPIAGGTDLMVLFEAGALPFKRLLNLWGLRELQGIVETPVHVTLGALTTFTMIRRSARLSQEFPLLVQAAAVTGGIATQNRGTIGGNIMNASPAADSPPALLVYDAELELLSLNGSRWVRYAEFHTGYKRLDLRPGELLGAIRLPRDKQGWRQFYRKVGTRKAQAISKVCFAGAILTDGNSTVRDIRIALGSVAPTTVRCFAAEESLRGAKLTPETTAQAQAALAGEIRPIDDIRSNAGYRLRVAQNVLGQFLDASRGAP